MEEAQPEVAPPPTWFTDAIGTVEMQTGETLRPAEAWLRYSGHRAGKGISPNQRDAVYWLTTVMVPEARKEREQSAARREREARFAQPQPPVRKPRVLKELF